MFRGHHMDMATPAYHDHVARYWREGQLYEGGKDGMLGKCYSLYTRRQMNLVLDIGGHMGNHAAFFAAVINAPVISFEPNPIAFEVLKINAALHGFKAVQMAIGDNDFLRYNIVPGPEGNTGMARAVPCKKGTVTGTTLDNYLTAFAPKKVSVIKIDVEGAEMKVLTGAASTIKKNLPDLWVETNDPVACQRMISRMAGVRYSVDGPYNATPTYRFYN